MANLEKLFEENLDGKTLVMGAGKDPTIRIGLNAGGPFPEGTVTLDMNKDHNPSVVWDLNNLPLPFKTDEFSQIHAYDTLEHFGAMGDYKSFFAFFEESWRILRHRGIFVILVPHPQSKWAWGDPGHVRIITVDQMTYLSQQNYKDQVGRTAMTDYRFCYKGDFFLEFYEVVMNDNNEYEYNVIILQANKGEKHENS